MIKLLYIACSAVIMLCTACTSDVEDFMMPENNALLGATITIDVATSLTDSTRINSSDITCMTWEKDDSLIAVGYDDAGRLIMNNNEVQTSIFKQKSDDWIGKKVSRFVGQKIEGAVKYKFMYTGSNAKYNAHNDKIEINYLNQQVTANNTSHIKHSLILVSDTIIGCQQDVILYLKNSIMKLTVRNIPASEKIKAVMCAVESDKGIKNVLGYATIPGIKKGNMIFLAFDPSHNLKKEGTIMFEFFTEYNTSYRVSEVSVEGKNYENGMIYTALIGGDESLNKFITPKMTSAQMLVKYEGNASDVQLKGFEVDGLTSTGYFLYTKNEGVLTELESNVFRGNDRIKEIILPDFVNSIADNAFDGCTSLVSTDIQEGICKIGSMIFSGCKNLKNVILPSSLTSVGKDIFSGCASLHNISIKSPAEQLESSYDGISNMFGSVTDRNSCNLHLHETWKNTAFNGFPCVNDLLFMNRITFAKIDYKLPAKGSDGLDVGGEIPDMPIN